MAKIIKTVKARCRDIEVLVELWDDGDPVPEIELSLRQTSDEDPIWMPMESMDLSLEAVISVAEEAMERAGQAGKVIHVPVDLNS